MMVATAMVLLAGCTHISPAQLHAQGGRCAPDSVRAYVQADTSDLFGNNGRKLYRFLSEFESCEAVVDIQRPLIPGRTDITMRHRVSVSTSTVNGELTGCVGAIVPDSNDPGGRVCAKAGQWEAAPRQPANPPVALN